MWHSVECFFKVQYKNVSLLPVINGTGPVLYYVHKLGFAAVFFSEGMLSYVERVVIVKVLHEVGANNVFQYFANEERQLFAT